MGVYTNNLKTVHNLEVAPATLCSTLTSAVAYVLKSLVYCIDRQCLTAAKVLRISFYVIWIRFQFELEMIKESDFDVCSIWKLSDAFRAHIEIELKPTSKCLEIVLFASYS